MEYNDGNERNRFNGTSLVDGKHAWHFAFPRRGVFPRVMYQRVRLAAWIVTSKAGRDLHVSIGTLLNIPGNALGTARFRVGPRLVAPPHPKRLRGGGRLRLEKLKAMKRETTNDLG